MASMVKSGVIVAAAAHIAALYMLMSILSLYVAVVPVEGTLSDMTATPLLGFWPFNGSLEDMSASQRGPAVKVNTNVALASDVDIPSECGKGGYLQIRKPGYINVPAVDFHAISFTVTFSLRIPSYAGDSQYMYADWSSGYWQFITSILPNRTMTVNLRRNIPTSGSDPEQGLIDLMSPIVLPLGAWFDVAFSFNRNTRTAALYLDQKRVVTATVRDSVTDVTLKASPSTYYQFGRKNDQPGSDGNLNADLRNLRIFGGAFDSISARELKMSAVQTTMSQQSG